MRQVLEAARMATSDEPMQRKVLDRVAQLLPTVPLDATPVDMGQVIHRLVREITGSPDPYQAVKKKSNDLSLALYPELKERVSRSSDPLLTAIRIAAAGNVVDFGPNLAIDLRTSIEQALANTLNQFAYHALKKKLNTVNNVLYLGDNAGEIVCDKILIEELIKRGKHVTFVVRGRPVLNDATMEDASYVGLDRIATVIANGSDAPGTTLADCSPEFFRAFRDASLIISKGQGNFEGLSGVRAPIFFLFKVKCPVVAQAVEAELGAIVLKEQEI
jgi:hypothetical protein